MKKAILLLGACICTATFANAQWISGGPEIGLNLSNISSAYNGDHASGGIRAGLKVGGVIDFGFTPHFSLQPGLFYSMKGTHETSFQSTSNPFTTTTSSSRYDYRISYLEIPVNFQYKFGRPRYGQFFIGAGPYVAFALGGKATDESGTTVTGNNGGSVSSDRSTTYTLNIGNNATDDVKTVDAGLNFNLGYQFARGLYFRGNAGLGLVNIMPGGDANNYMHNWGFGLSVGYLFGH